LVASVKAPPTQTGLLELAVGEVVKLTTVELVA
jgi:hypothetical protein